LDGTIMRISYLKDRPDLASQLIPGLLDHWRYVVPDDTAEARAARFRNHENHNALPIAWIAHDGDVALGTSALRLYDHPDRKDISPWLGGMYVEPHVRRQGIGAQLSHVVERKAVEMGLPKLYLFTHGQEHFYATLGWTYMEAATWRGLNCSIMCKVPGAV
jgi:N-acetylglutamate synthase-like GNAT family acetyltransferase